MRGLTVLAMVLGAALAGCGGDVFRSSDGIAADSGSDVVADEAAVDARVEGGPLGDAVPEGSIEGAADGGYDGPCTPIPPSPAYACATGSCFGNLSCFYGTFGAQCAVLPAGCSCAETLSCACFTGPNDPCRSVGQSALACSMQGGHATIECGPYQEAGSD